MPNCNWRGRIRATGTKEPELISKGPAQVTTKILDFLSSSLKILGRSIYQIVLKYPSNLLFSSGSLVEGV